MRPYRAETIPEHRLRDLRLLASDIDNTLTGQGKIRPEVLELCGRLRGAGVAVWLVTGRCAAWAQALSHYLEVDGVIAENGGAICRGGEIRILADTELIGRKRQRLEDVFEKIRARVPSAVVTDDNIGRLTDWTFERPRLTAVEIAVAAGLAAEAGLRLITSAIHVHLFAGEHSKATAVSAVCREMGIVDRQLVLTLGDSPNDEPLFDPDLFPFSVAVANVGPYLAEFTRRPLFVLDRPEAEGAMWLMRRILVSRGV